MPVVRPPPSRSGAPRCLAICTRDGGERDGQHLVPLGCRRLGGADCRVGLDDEHNGELYFSAEDEIVFAAGGGGSSSSSRGGGGGGGGGWRGGGSRRGVGQLDSPFSFGSSGSRSSAVGTASGGQLRRRLSLGLSIASSDGGNVAEIKESEGFLRSWTLVINEVGGLDTKPSSLPLSFARRFAKPPAVLAIAVTILLVLPRSRGKDCFVFAIRGCGGRGLNGEGS